MAHIRMATLQDAEAILAIYAPYMENTVVSFEYEAPSLAAFEQRMEGILAFYPYLVWEEDGKILVTAEVKNTGSVAGQEVVQVYYGAPQGKLGKAHSLIRCLISIHQILLIQQNDHRNFLIVPDGIRQLLHHRSVQIILIVHL